MKCKPRVMVVDDDANLRKTLSDILQLKGYEAVATGSGAEGIAEAKRDFVAVALIDLMLPDMSGIEVMGKIKAGSPLTEAIILTGHAALETAIEATNKGAFSYLLKPYKIDDLLLHIRRAVDRQEGQQEILRLASFPRMNPNPVLEVDAAGELTYLNPAAARVFPDLVVAQPVREALGDLSAAIGNGERKEVAREVNVGNSTFEQFLYPVPESDCVRIYMLDITERKEHEIKLGQINRLLIAIRNINEYLLVAESEEALYRFACEVLKGLEDIVGVIIGLKQPDYVLKPVAWAGFSNEMISALGLRWDKSATGGGLMGIAAREGKSMVAQDLGSDVRYQPWQDIVSNWGLGSAAAVPLVSEGEVIGVLSIYSRQRDAFDEQSTSFLAEAASDIAIGVRSLRLDRDLHATLDHLRRSMNSTVEAIAGMVELRDPYTAGHERRVAQLARAIGKEMGLPERRIEGLYVIGHLHDIGKIAVPAEILSKPTKLMDIELSMVKAHAQAGYDILKNLEFPWPVAQAVLQHHERLDGSGYPQGLNVQDIILEARILMVADVVEAMASHRPYRSAIGFREALAEITANRGKLYDEHVVDACVRLFNEKGFRFDSDF
ncbi:MAG TPA: HD domain-containing phosphohydrolase [Gallionella sp.]|nr:HD domain-containing phosphohydrolase [Gallionella sp.]